MDVGSGVSSVIAGIPPVRAMLAERYQKINKSERGSAGGPPQPPAGGQVVHMRLAS
jgi:hypothetical protein